MNYRSIGLMQHNLCIIVKHHLVSCILMQHYPTRRNKENRNRLRIIVTAKLPRHKT